MTPSAIREILKRAADWQLAHPRGEPDDWTNAVFYTGLVAVYRAIGNDRYLDELVRVGESLGWRPGSRYRHADDHAIAQSYLALFELRGEPETIAPFKDAIDRMMATPLNWEKSHQVIDYWWSDALFMSPPALVALAKATGSDGYLDFMDELWRQCYDLLWEEESRLFYRDIRFRERSPGEFWSRGNAWVLAGLARMLDDVPEDRPARRFYLEVFRKMAEEVVAIQHEDGLWRSDLLASSPDAPGETSGTALFCYALAWGIRAGVLERDRYFSAVERAWSALYQSVDEEGRLGWVQKPGASPDRVEAGDWATYGTGAFLLAGSEMLRLVEDERASRSRHEGQPGR
jgi:rhamnogalacturonyl hydrolase YesR